MGGTFSVKIFPKRNLKLISWMEDDVNQPLVSSLCGFNNAVENNHIAFNLSTLKIAHEICGFSPNALSCKATIAGDRDK